MNTVTVMGPSDAALTDSLDAPALDPIMLSIANESLAGKDIQTIAEEFDMLPDIVSQVLNKKEVESYINTVYLSQGYINRNRRMQLINTVIEAKWEEAMETQMYSKKDILDWVKVLNDMEGAARPKTAAAPAVAIQVNNNYSELMKDLLNG